MSDIEPTEFDAVVALVGGKLEQKGKEGTFFYHDEQIPPSESEVTAKLNSLISDWEALQYQRNRQYPELGEQLDMLFHDMTDGKCSKTGEWYKAIAKVKADNPKE